MEKVTFNVPAMYGDHHVLEVRRILLTIPGVKDVYASSAFQVVEVTYDPQSVDDLQIAAGLEEAGYLGEWTITAEKGQPATSGNGDGVYFRHTQVYENTRQVVTFAQTVQQAGRPLWPCPGFGPIKMMDEED
jgi:copper chaperone CopZ